MKTQVVPLDADPTADNGVNINVDVIPPDAEVTIYTLPPGKLVGVIDFIADGACHVSLMRGESEVVRVPWYYSMCSRDRSEITSLDGVWYAEHPLGQIVTGFNESDATRLVIKALKELHDVTVHIVWHPLKGKS